MHDLEKVIKGLECCVRSENKCCPMTCAFYNECFTTNGSTPFYPALRAALERLKEQEAKPIVVTTNAYGTKFYHCPKCNHDLYVYPRQRYCSQCGQAVK